MDWKMITFEHIDSVPDRLLCQICFQLRPRIWLSQESSIYCVQCMQPPQTQLIEPKFLFRLQNHSNINCQICKKIKTFESYQKHLYKCKAWWSSLDLIYENFIINKNFLIKCICTETEISKQCIQCFEFHCNQCQSSHQNCQQLSYNNYVAICKNEQCQQLLRQDQLVQHGLECEYRKRFCYKCQNWNGIQRNYKQHALNCYRKKKELAKKSEQNRLLSIPENQIKKTEILRLKLLIQGQQSLIKKKLSILDEI